LPQLKIPKWSFSLLGLFVGSLSLFIGAIGPVIAPFFIRDDLGKEEIVATKSFMQMGGHFLKIPAFFALGFEYGPYFTPLFSMVIMTIIGTKFGVIILKSINEKLFTIIYKVILFTAGVKLLFKIL
ncbi:MAG: TSUP family transporter, partial [Bdellovibrionales bacterium]|nr:TSUP family transporter [Bdellovibrionales bacterium]